ncbi:MAG TPA: metabolite traffic protein EboE [Vicinamibacterales bacterium]|nr:metabolite traffic protein EboE [Vicinamibacterales bacterium]
MDLGKGLGHLTYSTLVHQTDNWDQLWKSVNTYLPAVKARVAPHEKFGVCLRTSAPSIELLSTEPGKVADLKQFFADQDLYLYTANAFVYGVFKKQVIKEDVYEPDWATPERREYTKKVANLLAELAPDGINPSIQTAPLGFKPKVTGDDVVDAYTSNVIDVVAHLVELKKKTGKTVTLGLEPEPRCYLETTDETITYFKNRLFSGATAQRLAKKTGLNEADAAQAMRDYMGVVFDIGHQAVGYEDIPVSLQKLVDNGVQIVKLQEAASMYIPDVSQKIVDALQPFAKTIYLSQTCQKKDGKMTWFLNLEDAFEDWYKNPGPREWRTHFHVPVFLNDLGAFGTTRFALEQALAFHKKTPLSTHLEIETYTWDVLPDHLKTGDIVEYVTRELDWVKGQLV